MADSSETVTLAKRVASVAYCATALPENQCDIVARDVLNMPEMQAIRYFLRGVEQDGDWPTLADYGLPESVIAWAFGTTATCTEGPQP